MNREEGIRMLRDLLAAGTPGPWFSGVFRGDSEESPRDAYLKMFDAGDPTIMFSVGSEHESMQGSGLASAVTGNGPTSEANAILIAAAITNLPHLLNELEDLERENDRLRTIVRVNGLS